MIILSEFDAFQRLTSGLAMARDGALQMAAHQPDKAHLWAKMAEVYSVSMQSVYQLSAEAASKVTKQ